MGPFLKMAVWSVVVMVLMPFGHVHASPCPAGEHRLAFGGDCVPPVVKKTTNPTIATDSAKQKSFFVTGEDLGSGDAVLVEWKDYRAEAFAVNVNPYAGGQFGNAIWLAIYENGQFVEEFNVAAALGQSGGSPFVKYFHASGSGYGKGLWRLVVTNWGPDTQSFKFGNMIEPITLSCTDFADFELNPLTHADKTCLPPMCPDDVLPRRPTPEGNCSAPEVVNTITNPTVNSGTVGVDSLISFEITGQSVSLGKGKAVLLEWKDYRSQVFNLLMVRTSAGVYGSDIWFAIYENHHLVEEFNVAAAFEASSTVSKNFLARGSGYGKGLWRLVITNWGSGTQSLAFGPPPFKLSCEQNAVFELNPLTHTDKTCLAPQCPDGHTPNANGNACVPPCPGGERRPTLEGNCSLPEVADPITNPASSTGTVGVDSLFSFAIPSISLGAGKAVSVEWKDYRSEVFNLEMIRMFAGVYGSDIWFAIYENGQFVEEFNVAAAFEASSSVSKNFLARGSGYGKGLWRLVIANWGSGTQSLDFGPPLCRLRCEQMEKFELNPLTNSDKTCLAPQCPDGTIPNAARSACVEVTPPPSPPSPPPATPPPSPPSPATTCAYTSAVGFNVWSRWNVFTLAGVELNGGSIEGRIAAVGTVQALNSAQVHTKPEAFISTKENAANGGPWSITAKGAVTLTSSASGGGGGATTTTTTTVLNGGVESQSTITKTGVAVAGHKEAPNLSKLSADVDAAAAYFTARSEAWNGLAPSYIEANVSASEIRVQLHGKVNVVKEAGTLTTASLAGIEKITLTGHPLGTLIINVAGAGKAVLSQNLQVTYQGRNRNTSSTAEPLTFGRVVLNFNAAVELELLGGGGGGSSPSSAIDVSILAPKAAAVFHSGAPPVRGNVVALSLKAGNVDLGVLPFGTRVAASGAVPMPKRPFTTRGKHATACLWHTL